MDLVIVTKDDDNLNQLLQVHTLLMIYTLHVMHGKSFLLMAYG